MSIRLALLAAAVAALAAGCTPKEPEPVYPAEPIQPEPVYPGKYR
jgi:hypothetical protein